ncbi:MAG TPA: glycosyltransferase family 87 protein, partial [Gemmatimonadales bacterium]|nr:glycosyltransferase family 87 protein [Gemmatimonadales bacterium]
DLLADLSPRQRTWLFVFGALYAVLVLAVSVHKGGDFVNELPQSERLIAGDPVYLHNPATGIYWPPFALFTLMPFALLSHLSLALAKGAWAVGSLACLGWSVTRLAQTWGWRPALLAVPAVLVPMHANFETLNINIVLLALVVAAIVDVQNGRDQRAGVWIGIATALKAYPGLLLLYLAYRGRWRGLAVGTAVAGGLTYIAVLRYGPVGAFEALGRWVTLNREAQSVMGFAGQPLGSLVLSFGGTQAAVLAADALLLTAIVLAFARRAPADAAWELLCEMAVVAMAATVISPIGHYHYHVLAIPAWVAALSLAPPTGIASARVWRATLVVAAVFLSGVLTLGLYPDSIDVVKHYVRRHNYTWGALLLMGALLARKRPSLAAGPVPLATPLESG